MPVPGSQRPRRTPDRHPPRSLVITAAWAGLASALVAVVVAIAVVAVLWLPASGGSGSAGSALRAGIITFLAAVHGGVTVDGVSAGFVPLGPTVIVVIIVWRAATAVAGAADELGERRPDRLIRALAAQSAAFALTCTVLAAASPLGSSSASVAGSLGAGLLLTVVTAAAALIKYSVLGDEVRRLAPTWLGPGLRAAAAGLAVYVGAGALLVAGSLAVHHGRVMDLSREVGGGWSGVPVLVLGILAAPNAAVAAAGYVSGAGFAVGTGTTVSLTGTTSGLVPAFPILGALPESGGGSLIGWLFATLTPLASGAAVAMVAGRATTWRARWTNAVGAAGTMAVLGCVLAWQAGGGIGTGKLRAVGTSPWQFPLLAACWTLLVAAALLGLRAGLEALRGDGSTPRPNLRALLTLVESDGSTDADTPRRRDHLAG